MATVEFTTVETETTTYEPWTDGHAVGFRVTRRSDGAVGYLYLNPSMDCGEEEGTADVFVYGGPEGDPAQDASLHYYETSCGDVFGER